MKVAVRCTIDFLPETSEFDAVVALRDDDENCYGCREQRFVVLRRSTCGRSRQERRFVENQQRVSALLTWILPFVMLNEVKHTRGGTRDSSPSAQNDRWLQGRLIVMRMVRGTRLKVTLLIGQTASASQLLLGFGQKTT